jgi:hypothetical protein
MSSSSPARLLTTSTALAEVQQMVDRALTAAEEFT